MAYSTYNVVLKWGASAEAVAQESGFHIKDFPDLGGPANMIETTHLESAIQTFINGVKQSGSKEFTYEFDKTVYGLVESDADTALYYSLEFGTAGATAKVTWQGMHSTYMVGAGVDGVLEAKIVIAPSSDFTVA